MDSQTIEQMEQKLVELTNGIQKKEEEVRPILDSMSAMRSEYHQVKQKLTKAKYEAIPKFNRGERLKFLLDTNNVGMNRELDDTLEQIGVYTYQSWCDEHQHIIGFGVEYDHCNIDKLVSWLPRLANIIVTKQSTKTTSGDSWSGKYFDLSVDDSPRYGGQYFVVYNPEDTSWSLYSSGARTHLVLKDNNLRAFLERLAQEYPCP